MNGRPDDIDLINTQITGSGGLEWAMQSQQVSDEMLTQALFGEYYPNAFRLASFLLADPAAAGAVSEQALLKITSLRHRYWGEASIPSLVYAHVMYLALAHPALVPSRASQPGADLASLERNQALVILLKHGLHLDTAGIAEVLQRSPQAAISLLAAAYNSLLSTDPEAAGDPSPPHSSARAALLRQAAGDSPTNPLELPAHLDTCESCRRYRYALDNTLRRLPAETAAVFPYPDFPPEKLAQLAAEAHQRGRTHRRGWNFLSRSKEAILIGFVIFAVLAGGWFATWLTGSEQTGDSPPPIEPQSLGWYQDAPSPSPAPASESTGSGRTSIQSYDLASGYSLLPADALPIVKRLDIASTYPPRRSGLFILQSVLHYWNWEGEISAPPLQMPIQTMARGDDLIDIVQTSTDLQIIRRYAGSIDQLGLLASAGYPVIIEDEAGYDIVFGVDETTGTLMLASQVFTWTDSAVTDIYIHPPVEEDEFYTLWRPYNYAYFVIYPAEKEPELQALLGDQFNELVNLQFAADLARRNAAAAGDLLESFHQLYNLGASLTLLADYQAAVQAFDQAYSFYQNLCEDCQSQASFALQPGMYQAYYHANRYYDMITYANEAIHRGRGDLFDSYYWRSIARYSLGDWDGAQTDLRTALEMGAELVCLQNSVDRTGCGEDLH